MTETIVGDRVRVVFDSNNRNWVPSPEHNRLFLRAIENHANAVLQARGCLLLNDLYDMLGMPRSRYGLTSGWVSHGNGIVSGWTSHGNGVVSFQMPSPSIIEFAVDGNVENFFPETVKE